jgi:hypothetical protein
MMPDTATWRPLMSRDDYGAPTYGAAVPFANARLVRSPKLVRDASGDQVVSSAQLWLVGTPAIAPDDQVTLSDGTTPSIVNVGRWQDEAGESHTKVFFR